MSVDCDGENTAPGSEPAGRPVQTEKSHPVGQAAEGSERGGLFFFKC